MNNYRISMVPAVDRANMDQDDKSLFDDYKDQYREKINTFIFEGYTGLDEDEALDNFYNDIPIAFLEDFDISVDLVGPGLMVEFLFKIECVDCGSNAGLFSVLRTCKLYDSSRSNIVLCCDCFEKQAHG